LKVYGIKNDEERRASVLKPKTCERCAEANQATNKFCHKCGFPLDPETKADVLSKELDRKEADRVLDSLLDDDEFREMFVRKVAKLSSKCQSI
jgi:ribosomal protein L37E